METLVSKLVSTLRQNGFRPFRPLENSKRPSESCVESRITGLQDFGIRLRLPWQPNLVTCALSIDLKGRRLVQKKLRGFSSQGHRVVYDATVDVSGGVAVFKGRRWKTLRRAKFDRLIRDAVDGILWDLRMTAAPFGAASGSLFEYSNISEG